MPANAAVPTPNLMPLLADGNSRAARSFRARLQWRGRDGKWIPMGGAMSFLLRLGDGSTRNVRGTFVGVSSDPNKGWVRVDADTPGNEGLAPGFYKVDRSNGLAEEQGVAVLPDDALKQAGIDPNATAAKYALDISDDQAAQSLADVGPFEAPEGWTRHTQESNNLPAWRTNDGSAEIRERRTEDGDTFYQVADLQTGADEDVADVGQAFKRVADADRAAEDGADAAPIEAFLPDGNGDLSEEAKNLEKAADAPRIDAPEAEKPAETPENAPDAPENAPETPSEPENAPDDAPEAPAAPENAPEAPETAPEEAEDDGITGRTLPAASQRAWNEADEATKESAQTILEDLHDKEPGDGLWLDSQPDVDSFAAYEKNDNGSWTNNYTGDNVSPAELARQIALNESRGGSGIRKFDSDKPVRKPRARKAPAAPAETTPDAPEAAEETPAKADRLDDLLTEAEIDATPAPEAATADERLAQHVEDSAAALKAQPKAVQQAYMAGRRASESGRENDYGIAAQAYASRRAKAGRGAPTDEDTFVNGWLDYASDAPVGSSFDPDGFERISNPDWRGRDEPQRTAPNNLYRPLVRTPEMEAERRAAEREEQRRADEAAAYERGLQESLDRYKREEREADLKSGRRIPGNQPQPPDYYGQPWTKDDNGDWVRPIGIIRNGGRPAQNWSTPDQPRPENTTPERTPAAPAADAPEETDAQRATREGAEAESRARAERRRERDSAVSDLDSDRFTQSISDALDDEGATASPAEIRRNLGVDEIVDMLSDPDNPPTDAQIDEAFDRADMYISDLDANGMLSRDAGGDLTRDLQGYREAIKAEAADRRAAPGPEQPRAETPNLLDGIDDLPETPAAPADDNTDAIDPADFDGDDSNGFTPDPTKPWQVSGAEHAEVYDALESDFDDPEVQASYAALEEAIVDQYRWIRDERGIDIDLSNSADPYETSADMVRDVTENGHLAAYADNGAGLPEGHPMNRFIEVDGQRVHLNDMFRAVHDYMGHVLSGERGATVSFGEKGEWEAWRTHRQSLPRDSWMALWTETRGQNTWTNYADDHYSMPQSERPFGEQKAGRVDESVSHSDLIGDEDETNVPWEERRQAARDTPEPEPAPEPAESDAADIGAAVDNFRQATDDLIEAIEVTDLADMPSTDENRRQMDIAALRDAVANPESMSNQVLAGLIRRYGFDKEAGQEWRAAREAVQEAATGGNTARVSPNKRIRDAAADGDKDAGIEDVLQAAEMENAPEAPSAPAAQTMRERFKLRKQRGFSSRRTTPVSEREQEILDEITAMDDSTEDVPDYIERRKALQDELQAISKRTTTSGRRARDNEARQRVRDERRQIQQEEESGAEPVFDEDSDEIEATYESFASGRRVPPTPERVQELQEQIARTDIPDGNRIVTVLPDGSPLVYEMRGGRWTKVQGPATERTILPGNADLAGTPFGRGQSGFVESRMRPLTPEQLEALPTGAVIQFGPDGTLYAAKNADGQWVDGSGDVLDGGSIRNPIPLWQRGRAERGLDNLLTSEVVSPNAPARRETPAPAPAAPERAPAPTPTAPAPTPTPRDPLERTDGVTPTPVADTPDEAARAADEIAADRDVDEPDDEADPLRYLTTEQGAVTNDREKNKRIRRILSRLTDRMRGENNPGMRRHSKNETATSEGMTLANQIASGKGRDGNLGRKSPILFKDDAERRLEAHGFDARLLADMTERSNSGRGETFLTDDKKQKIISSVYAAAYQRMVEDAASLPAGRERDEAIREAGGVYRALKDEIRPALFGQSTWQESVLRDLDVAKTLINTRQIDTDQADFFHKMATLPGQSAAGRRHLIDHLMTLPGKDPAEVIEKIQYWEKNTEILSMSREEVLESRATIESPDSIQRHLLEQFPNAAILPNGDMVIGEHMDTNNNTLYRAIVSRSSDGRFQTGVVSINGDTNEAHFRAITKGAQSVRALEGNLAHFAPLFSEESGRETLGSFMDDRNPTTMRIDLSKFFAPGGRSYGAFLTRPRYFADDEKQAKAEAIEELVRANPDASNAAIIRAAAGGDVSAYFARQALAAIRNSIVERMGGASGGNHDTHIDTLGQRVKEGDWVDYTFRQKGHPLDGEVFRGQVSGFAKVTSNRGSYSFEDNVRFVSPELRDALAAVERQNAAEEGRAPNERVDKTFTRTAGNVLKVDDEYAPMSEPFDGEHTRLMANLSNDHLENLADIAQNPEAAERRAPLREAQNVDYDPVVDVSLSPKVSGVTRHRYDDLLKKAAAAPTEEVRAGDLKDGDAIAILNEKTGQPEFVVVYNVRRDPDRGVVEFDSYSPKENLRGELLREGLRVRDTAPVLRKDVGEPEDREVTQAERLSMAKRLIESAKMSDAERRNLADEVWPDRDSDTPAPTPERLDEIITDMHSRKEVAPNDEAEPTPQEAAADEAAVQQARTAVRAKGGNVPPRWLTQPRATVSRRGNVDVRPKDIRTRGAKANVRRVDGEEVVVGDLLPVQTYKREKDGSVTRKPGYLRIVETDGTPSGSRAIIMAPEDGFGLRDPRTGRIRLKHGTEIDFAGDNRRRWSQSRYRSTGVEGYDEAVSGLTRKPGNLNQLVWDGPSNPTAVTNSLMTNRFGEGFTVLPDGSPARQGYVIGEGGNDPANRFRASRSSTSMRNWLAERIAAYPDADGYGWFRDGDTLVFDPVTFHTYDGIDGPGLERAREIARTRGEDSIYSFERGEVIPTEEPDEPETPDDGPDGGDGGDNGGGGAPAAPTAPTGGTTASATETVRPTGPATTSPERDGNGIWDFLGGNGIEGLEKAFDDFWLSDDELDLFEPSAPNMSPRKMQMDNIYRLLGLHDTHPTVLPPDEYHRMVKDNEVIPIFRGVNPPSWGDNRLSFEEMANQFRDEQQFIGGGVFGSGTYVGQPHEGYFFSGSDENRVMALGLKEDARILDYAELQTMIDSAQRRLMDEPGYSDMSPTNARAMRLHQMMQFLGDEGRVAAAMGYDGVFVRDHNQDNLSGSYLMFNRGALIMNEEYGIPGFTEQYRNEGLQGPRASDKYLDLIYSRGGASVPQPGGMDQAGPAAPAAAVAAGTLEPDTTLEA